MNELSATLFVNDHRSSNPVAFASDHLGRFVFIYVNAYNPARFTLAVAAAVDVSSGSVQTRLTADLAIP
ncbi:MAG: hypothetical protein R3E64_15050 [Halioglobus sp.]